MTEILVDRISEDEHAYSFRVTVCDPGSQTHHAVTISREDLQRLTTPEEAPESFLRRCFRFLLEREPKESILDRFDIRTISLYFPEFPSEIAPSLS
jgi:hypothetical protein